MIETKRMWNYKSTISNLPNRTDEASMQHIQYHILTLKNMNNDFLLERCDRLFKIKTQSILSMSGRYDVRQQYYNERSRPTTYMCLVPL